jgi:GPI mannosyltransferase 4
MTSSALVFTCLAIATDTAFYNGPDSTASFRALFKSLSTTPVITPWNSIRYNMQTSNLALHGLHPRHQHFSVNLPQLLGPALILLVISSSQPLSIRNLALPLSNPCFLSAMSGTALLSIFPHQEPRFLLPCVPLLLTCVRTPTSPKGRKWFWTSWLTFNIVLGTLIGVYHQGGVIPAQLQVPAQIKLDHSTNHPGKTTPAMVFWWKTYPPPTYLLGKTNPFDISTVPLLGLPHRQMVSKLSSALPPTCDDATTPLPEHQPVYLVAPLASHFFLPASSLTPNISFSVDASPTEQDTADDAQQARGQHTSLSFTLQWKHRRHINLDDMDIGEEGLWITLRRVVGRRGLGIWRVRRVCDKRGWESKERGGE